MTLSLSLASKDNDGTGEILWETIERNYPQPTTNIALPHPETLENVIKDPSQAKEDFAENGRGDDDDGFDDNGSFSCRDDVDDADIL